MITQVRGVLHDVGDDNLTLGVGPFELSVLIPEFARRALLSRSGEIVCLHTLFDIEGNQHAGRMTPRLIGFLSSIDREFFEVLCSVDGMGVRKSLRAMVRPVRELARLIQDRDVKMLTTFPGIGEAMAERIVAKTRRKVGKFTLIVEAPASALGAVSSHAEGADTNGFQPAAQPDVIQDAFAALLSVGHNDSQARDMIDRVLASGRSKYRCAADIIEAIYIRTQESSGVGGDVPRHGSTQ